MHRPGKENMNPPVSEGDEVEVKCFKKSDKPGRGICTVGSFIVFVDGMEPGDEKRVRISAVKETYAFGELI